MRSVILFRDHEDDCVAVRAVRRGQWTSEWVLTEEFVYRDKNGGYTGSTTLFMKVICKDPHCNAEALLNTKVVEDFVHQKLNGIGSRNA